MKAETRDLVIRDIIRAARYELDRVAAAGVGEVGGDHLGRAMELLRDARGMITAAEGEGEEKLLGLAGAGCGWRGLCGAWLRGKGGAVMKGGHCNITGKITHWHEFEKATEPGVARVPLHGGRTLDTCRELPPLALRREEWEEIGRVMGWLGPGSPLRAA